MMRTLVRDGARQLAIREAAIRAVRVAGARSHDPLAELMALFHFVRDRVRFTRDIHGVETLQSPRYTLHTMAGDCDDRAVLLAALARSIGLPADLSFKAIGADRRAPGRFSHVYVIARLLGRQIGLDPTYSSNAFGWEFPNPTRVLEVPV